MTTVVVRQRRPRLPPQALPRRQHLSRRAPGQRAARLSACALCHASIATFEPGTGRSGPPIGYSRMVAVPTASSVLLVIASFDDRTASTCGVRSRGSSRHIPTGGRPSRCLPCARRFGLRRSPQSRVCRRFPSGSPERPVAPVTRTPTVNRVGAPWAPTAGVVVRRVIVRPEPGWITSDLSRHFGTSAVPTVLQCSQRSIALRGWP